MTILTPIAVSSAPLLRAIAAGGDLSGKALAEAAGRKPNNISRDLGVMEKAGLITREPGSPPALTDDGVAALAELDGNGPSTAPGFGEFDIDLIDQDPTLNPRVIFDDEELDGLAASIRDKGVTQPILIRQGVIEGRYRIVAGERRWRASRKAEKTTIPAMYRELTDAQAFEIATIENIQRTDLSPLEEARAFRRIIDTRMAEDPALELKDAKATIAYAVRKTIRYVEQRMDLLELPPITQVRLELDKDDHGHLSLKEARNEVQKQRAREREAKGMILPQDELLALAEIYDAIERYPDRLEGWHYYDRKPVAVAYRALEDGEIIPRLIAKGALQLTKGWRGDARNFVNEGYGGWSPKEIDRQLPGFLSKDRSRVLDARRIHVLGKTEADRIHATWLPLPAGERGEYASWFLNEPCVSIIDPTLNDAAEAYLAEQDRQRALEFDRKFREGQAKERADEAIEAGKRMLAAVREFEEEAPGMGHDEFTAAFAELQSEFGIAGPYTLTLDEGRNDVTIRDGAGEPSRAAGAGLEARRRMYCIAMNYAAGFAPMSGDDLDTVWARPNSRPAEEPEVLPSRAEFIGMIAVTLEEATETSGGYISEDTAEQEAEQGLVAFLAKEDISYGDEGFDWNIDGATTIAELIRLHGLGQDDDAQIDIEDAIEAQADDEATPDYLRNLAGPGPGPGADAEAGQ